MKQHALSGYDGTAADSATVLFFQTVVVVS
jgi:hypothetical protein